MVGGTIRSFRHKGLKALFETGTSKRVPPSLQRRIVVRLDALEAAANLRELNQPGFDFHPLRGKPQRHSIHVNGPWCVTLERIESSALHVDPEQHHRGKFDERFEARTPDPSPALSSWRADAGDTRRPCAAADRPGGAAHGDEPEHYLRMQDNHDLWHARRRLASKLDRLEPAAA